MGQHKTETAVEQLISLQKATPNKKILHFGSLAGWPYTMASESRNLGVEAENVVHTYKDVLKSGVPYHDRKFLFDKEIFKQYNSLPSKVISTLKFLREIPSKYSIVHYHSTTLMHREYHFLFEGRYLRKHRVPMVLSLGGSDARLDREAGLVNPYYYKDPRFLHDLRIKLRWASWSKNVSVCAAEPEMRLIALDYFEDVKIFRQPVAMERFEFNPPVRDKDVPVILHVPTNPQVKGTKYVYKAIEDLKRRGLKFEFKFAERLTHQEFLKEMSECDIYVDELRCGAHGMTSVEAMAMGKPTITFIRDNLISSYPNDLPLVNGNPDTIREVLEKLIKDPQLRHDIGIKSRKYVEKFHAAEVVIEELSQIYVEQINKYT